jgi:hypothetical protein
MFAAFAFTGCHTYAPKDPTLKVGSYNIRLQTGDKGTPNAWDARKADMVELIRKLDLDAFGLQEVCPGQVDYLTNNLPQYAFIGEHRNADRISGEASPVFYRKDRFEALKSGTFWLSETPDVPGSKSWNTACTRVCSWMWLRDKNTGIVTYLFSTENTAEPRWSKMADGNGIAVPINEIAAGDCHNTLFIPWDASKIFVEGCPDERNVWSYIIDIITKDVIQLPTNEGLIAIDPGKREIHMSNYLYHPEGGRYSVERVYTIDGKFTGKEYRIAD